MIFGYIIGRFNPLHLGHHELIDYMINNSDHHVIFIGSANESRTDSNPLSFDERKQLMSIHYPKSTIIGLDDLDDMDTWIHVLENHITEESTKYNGIKSISIFSPVRDDDHSLRASWINDTHDLETFSPSHDISATELRSLWRNKDKFSKLVKKDTGLFLDSINL